MANNSANKGNRKLSPNQKNVTSYIKEATDNILHLLNKVEGELNSRSRINVVNGIDGINVAGGNRWKEAVKKIEVAKRLGRSCAEDVTSDVSYNGGDNKMKLETKMAAYKNTEKHLVRQNSTPSNSPEKNDRVEIDKKWANVDFSKGEGRSYVDFNKNLPEVKWHKGYPGVKIKNATPIGYTKTGKPLIAGRTWDEKWSFLIPAYVNLEEGKCIYGKRGRLRSSKSFEVMESKHVAWKDAMGNPVCQLPQCALNAGYNERDEPLYFGRAFIDGAVIPGYVEEQYVRGAPNNRVFTLVVPYQGGVFYIRDRYEVMVAIPHRR